jgi:hypothetical protein
MEWSLPINEVINDANKDGLKNLIRSGRAVALVGAGISKWAGYPLWSELIQQLVEFACEQNPGKDDVIRAVGAAPHGDLLQIAQELSSFLEPRHFKRFLTERLGTENVHKHPVFDQICVLPFRDILTLNLDPMLELAHFTQEIRVRTYSAAESGVVASFLKSGDEPEHARNLIYLHGKYSDPIDRIALTKDGYDLLYKQQAFSTLMIALAATRRIVFLGFGFEDKRVLDSFQTTTSYLGDVTLCHYAILPFDENKVEENERETYRSLWNVEVIYYDKTPGHPDGSHSQFAALVQEFAVGLNVRHVPAQAVTPAAVVQPPGNLDAYLDAINGPNLATLRGDDEL